MLEILNNIADCMLNVIVWVGFFVAMQAAWLTRNIK